MSSSRVVLVALAGSEDPALADRLAHILRSAAPQALEVRLIHVIDENMRVVLSRGLAPHRAPWLRPPIGALDQRLAVADEEGAAALLAIWRERFAAAFPDASVSTVVARGRAERAVVEAAHELEADVLVVCARPGPGPAAAGPSGVGHVARFVVDHSPAPVLLVRGD